MKFSHRGIVAMANENKPNTNHSQFFITLDATDYLNGKHTIFGKVVGDTVFNVVKMGELDTDADDQIGEYRKQPLPGYRSTVRVSCVSHV